MSETIFTLVTTYGARVVFASAYLSCLAVPIPTSLIMLAAGAFVATGDLEAVTVVAAALAGAILGDQSGYLIGRYGGTPLAEWLAQDASRRKVLDRARAMVDRHGTDGVFLSTWLFAPLGPWVNLIAGTAGLAWMRFALVDAVGEVVWVAVYIGLGYAFAEHIESVSQIMGNVVGIVAGLGLMLAAAFWIRNALRSVHAVSQTRE